MSSVSRILAIGALLSLGLTACGGGGGESTGADAPLNTDYSTLRLAESRDAPLQYASDDEQMLAPLRNGLRLMTQSSPVPTFVAVTTAAGAGGQVAYSATTVQVDGVDEADAVRYDGRYIYTTRRQVATGSSMPTLSQNVLAIARTDATAATIEPVSTFVLEDQQSAGPLLYQLPRTGQAEYIVAVSQDFSGWAMPAMLPVIGLVVQPDRTTVQLLDVRDPLNVSQAWKLRFDGWLNASRMIGDTLYLVTSYRPRIPNIVLPADTQEKREANERLIRNSSAAQLLPQYSENGGAARSLVPSHGCLIAQQTQSIDAYTDLLVIAAINVRTRKVIDVNCLSTNINGVYMSRDSLYVAGTTIVSGTSPGQNSTTLTVLHKFAIKDGEMSYRATGSVAGHIGWSNPSYFMDEQNGDLRVLTSEQLVHRLTVLRESGTTLSKVATLPNAARPAPIGKTGEQVFAVRFVGDRGYIVTFRFTDPLYVLDLHDPADPAIAGELEIPGVSNYLRAIDDAYLLAVGQEAVNGRRTGIKVELFDVRDIAHPQSLGAKVFGNSGSWSDALNDPHAITFLERPAPDASLRLVLPIDVYDVPTSSPTLFGWRYSGLHVLEVAGTQTASPQLRLHGLIETADNGSSQYPPRAFPQRGILHDDAVFGVDGERFFSKRWQDFPTP